MSRPGRPKAEAEIEQDGYRRLVAAIVQRAVSDASGTRGCWRPTASSQERTP